MQEDDLDLTRIERFAANLRYVCDQRGSVSNICRKAQINRQQFNKYLAGKHLPSKANTRIIANYFGLSPEVMFSDSDEFQALVEGNFFETFNRLRRQPQAIKFLSSVMGSAETSGPSLVGVYDRYQYSSIYQRRILKASLCIYRGPDLLQHTYVERFPSHDNPSMTAYTFRYHGFVLPIEGRVFTIDFESIQRNELTFGILSAVQRSSKTFMFGITSGIAASMFRQPFSTRLALHYRKPGLLTRSDLEGTTTLDMNHPSIPREIREYLGDNPDMIMPH
ncbi:helix-turn-helix transcriptional regulator [Microvirga sp. BT689]|uniref:helix-turn-helix domain-containing protein n=1 Tax=Microvirga arvi TaxID=2778731 RepID=UPI00195130A1|nr:helix-turn-helix transcriptional regulator [Microvirga arvi]MBM6584187.1 helix-turn-helix transcriptional regulator [Microvirga arvi]